MQTGLEQKAIGREVADWRREQLLRSGFEPQQASLLASDRRYDLHALIELVERGCPPALAIRILSPLDGEGPA